MPATKKKALKNNPPLTTVNRRKWRVLFLATTLFILLMIASTGLVAATKNKVVFRAEVGQLKVGGLSAEAAGSKISNKTESVTSQLVSINGEDPIEITLADAGMSYDLTETVKTVYNYGKTGPYWLQWWQNVAALFVKPRFEPVVEVDQVALHEALEKNIYSKYETDAKEVSLIIKDGQVEIVPGVAGKMLNHDELERRLLNNIASFSNQTIKLKLSDFSPKFTASDAENAKQQALNIIAEPLSLTFDNQKFIVEPIELAKWVTTETVKNKLVATADQDRLLTYLRALAKDKINKKPTNAKVSFESGKLRVIEASTKGFELQEESSQAAVTEALQQRAMGEKVATAELVVKIEDPHIDDQKLSELGIKELIGRAETSYTTSPTNRKHNIAVGAQKVTGTILLPGEEFDLVNILGDVSAATGYLPELVISNGKLERQYGGGLCQPTTTLFRAVLDAGLPVTSRYNHSRRVAYYEKPSTVKGVRINWDSQMANQGSSMIGYDATVYIPEPNFKFKNDYQTAVLVQAFITNNSSVTFELYGTNDGRQVSVGKAVIDYTRAPGQPVFDPDPTKPSMTMELIEKGTPGAKTHFDYTVTYADGSANKQTFESFYKPIPDHYLVGTAEAQSAPEGEPAPAQ